MLKPLLRTSLRELQAEAFRLRKIHFGNRLTFSIPGTMIYQDNLFPFSQSQFPAISLTGHRCELLCGHCQGKLLKSMIPIETPETLLRVTDQLLKNGTQGVLLSGGANLEGEVPLRNFIPIIKELKSKAPEFKVIVHTGLIKRNTAEELKEAKVDQILIDMIGEDETIQNIYHLHKRVEDYEDMLWMLKEIGHRLAPHIIIGHHFGEIRGEWRALEIITRVGVDTLVLVVFKPLHKETPLRIPAPQEVSKISAIARILNPALPIRMGCIKPAHPWKIGMERGCIDSGVNTIAYPLYGTIEYAKTIGLKIEFIEMCCSLI
ncbi:MAG: radical SAM protein [Thermodesulfobacteriota bacterium]